MPRFAGGNHVDEQAVVGLPPLSGVVQVDLTSGESVLNRRAPAARARSNSQRTFFTAPTASQSPRGAGVHSREGWNSATSTSIPMAAWAAAPVGPPAQAAGAEPQEAAPASQRRRGRCRLPPHVIAVAASVGAPAGAPPEGGRRRGAPPLSKGPGPLTRPRTWPDRAAGCVGDRHPARPPPPRRSRSGKRTAAPNGGGQQAKATHVYSRPLRRRTCLPSPPRGRDAEQGARARARARFKRL